MRISSGWSFFNGIISLRNFIKLDAIDKIEIDNVIAEVDGEGKKKVRFQPVPAWETLCAIDALCKIYDETHMDETIDPLIVIPMFVLDFLCIHPFNDGNGRMSRLLTLLLLYRSKYIVGKYISIEKMIETTKDTYPLDVIEQMNLHANKDSAFSKYMDDVIFKLRTPLMLSKLATELREGY